MFTGKGNFCKVIRSFISQEGLVKIVQEVKRVEQCYRRVESWSLKRKHNVAFEEASP